MQSCDSTSSKHTETENPIVEALNQLERDHPIWSCRLLQGFEHGFFTKEDCRYVFGQYFLYSKNFTRYLAALMATCDKDYYRSRLSENLWEEGGGAAPETRHAEIFRKFLREGLDINIDTLVFENAAVLFSKEYLDYCIRSHPAATSAFLSLGTEGIIARLYAVFCEGLLKAGVAEKDLHFFRLHMECDDEHAHTLKEMMLSYQDQEEFASMARQGLTRALDLRLQFFDALYEGVRNKRLEQMFAKIQEKTSLADSSHQYLAKLGQKEEVLYSNTNERLNVEFGVTRLPFDCEVLDPRIVRIAPNKANENHKHAHETVFFIVKGSGRVCVDDQTVQVTEGDFVFVPRWCRHQSHNDTNEEMVILAIADFGLTGKAFVGNYLKTARLKQDDQVV